MKSHSKLGGHSTTAQVHPGLFTNFFSEQFTSRPNTSLILGRANSLKLNDNKAKSVTIQPKDGGAEQEIPADVVVIAAGPWTGRLALELLGKQVGSRLGVDGHRAHSIVLKTKEPLSAHCLFTHMGLADNTTGEPEVYARPDGTAYM